MSMHTNQTLMKICRCFALFDFQIGRACMLEYMFTYTYTYNML